MSKHPLESTNHSSIDLLDDDISEDMKSSLRELLGGTPEYFLENDEEHVKRSSSFTVISEGLFKKTSNSYSSNKTIHTVMSNEGVSETSDHSSLGLWVIIGILVLVIILGLLFLL